MNCACVHLLLLEIEVQTYQQANLIKSQVIANLYSKYVI